MYAFVIYTGNPLRPSSPLWTILAPAEISAGAIHAILVIISIRFQGEKGRGRDVCLETISVAL